MVTLNTFVENRRQDDITKKERQVMGDRYRVPVPPTRFDRAVSMPGNQNSSTLPLTPSRPILELGPSRRRETHGFDTDAESIGESTTMNSLSQATHHHTTDKNVAFAASAGSEHARDHSRDQYEESSLPDNGPLAPRVDDNGSGEDESAKHKKSHNVHYNLFTQTQSEEFIHFKKRNDLNKRFTQASHASQAYAPDRCLTASSSAPFSAVEETFAKSSRSLTPAREYADSVSFPKSQSPGDDRVKSVGFPDHRVTRNNSNTLSSLAIHDRLAEVSYTDQHRECTPQPLSLNTPGKVDHANGRIKLNSVPRLHSTEEPHHPDHEFADYSILDSELGDEHGPEVTSQSGMTHGTLKRKSSLDHSSDQLHLMNFPDLLKDPFDGISTTADSIQSSGLVGPSLRATLDQLSSGKTSGDFCIQPQSFFEELSLGQYVECGEVIAGRLNEAISKLSRIRQEKRQVVGKFEGEIVQREATIRGTVAALKRKKGVMTRQTEELTAKRTAQTELKE